MITTIRTTNRCMNGISTISRSCNTEPSWRPKPVTKLQRRPRHMRRRRQHKPKPRLKRSDDCRPIRSRPTVHIIWAQRWARIPDLELSPPVRQQPENPLLPTPLLHRRAFPFLNHIPILYFSSIPGITSYGVFHYRSSNPSFFPSSQAPPRLALLAP